MNTITKSIVSLAAVVITATTALSAGALAMSNAENMLFEAEAQNIATEEWNTTESGKTVLRFSSEYNNISNYIRPSITNGVTAKNTGKSPYTTLYKYCQVNLTDSYGNTSAKGSPASSGCDSSVSATAPTSSLGTVVEGSYGFLMYDGDRNATDIRSRGIIKVTSN